MITTKKKAPILHKNLAVPRSPQHHQNNSKSRKKTKSIKPKDSLIKVKSREKILKPVNSNRLKTQLSPSGQRKSNSKSRSLKKSKAEQTERSRGKKNVYTSVDQKDPNFVQNLTEKSFKKVGQFKLQLLGYIFRKRLVKDSQYNELYEQLVQRFPQHEPTIKQSLFEIVSSLDS